MRRKEFAAQSSSLEDTWLDEALAHFAEDANGRALKALSETSNASFTTLFSNVTITAHSSSRTLRGCARGCRVRGTIHRSARTPPHRSPFAELHVALRYTADQYAPGGDIKAFTKALAGGPNIGVNNLTLRAGSISFDSLVAGWMVANYADEAGIVGLNPKYTYKVYDMRSNMAAQPNSSNQQYPCS